MTSTTNIQISEQTLQRRKLKKQAKRKLECYKFTRRLYRFIRHHPENIEFKKFYNGWAGSYDYDTTEIELDYRRDVVSTLVHEFLHHIQPDWNHTKIRTWESRMMNSLTPRQYKNILRVIVEYV